MNSFSSELGVQFETCLEAPHVIDVESQVHITFFVSIVFFGSFWFNSCSRYKLSNLSLQVWPAIISTGAGNYPLNASYKTADAYEFQVLLHVVIDF